MKLFAENQKDMEKMLEITRVQEISEKFNNTVGMKLNIDKCAVIVVHRGQI